ncbi:TetR/AcrR family transcriptional regulator [Mycobacterium sp. NAZ190054]|uniref:TetR/AcrR family transcriptional regulator n=1 Tax=Mycobacterium sp. NAZ190054 TaxID=1747766 RepID=UPI00079B4008|nr:TetR/AcrR family transcriptional regulator [Mycobacterium sp. NAZ190054]KWX66129.1 hypothetical protein ASJ79_06650 [Mycobacterium sp. NAZ190054]
MRTSGDERATVQAIRNTAAELFTTKGYTATTTREIALRVGIKQASLYYYFPTKQAILESLMLDTVAAPLTAIAHLESADCSPAVRLHAAASCDMSQLLVERWNLGALYMLPEIRNLPDFASFFALNARLRQKYRQMCAAARAAAGLSLDPTRLSLPYRLVETVIRMRADSEDVDIVLIADAVLRTLELDDLSDAERLLSADLARAALAAATTATPHRP